MHIARDADASLLPHVAAGGVRFVFDGPATLRGVALLRADAPGAPYRDHQALASPAWLRDAVVYQLSVRAFGGDFDGVRARLGYLADLG